MLPFFYDEHYEIIGFILVFDQFLDDNF